MAMNIGSIFAELGAKVDRSGFIEFDKAVKKSIATSDTFTDRQGKLRTVSGQLANSTDHLNRSQRGLNRSMGSMGKTISGTAGGFAIAAAGTVGFTKALGFLKVSIEETANAGKSMVNLSRITGMDNKTSAQWVLLAKQRKMSGEQLNGSFLTLSRNMSKALKGGDQQIAMFKALGISHETVKRGNFEEILAKAADGLNKLGPGAERNAIGLGLFGKSFQSMLPILSKGQGGMFSLLKVFNMSSDRLVKGEKDTKKFNSAMKEMGNATTDLQIAVGTKLIPVLTPMIKDFTRFINQMASGKGAGGQFADAIKNIASGMKVVWDTLRPVVSWMIKMTAQHPDIAKIAVSLFAIGAAVKLIRFAGAITGMGKLIGLTRSLSKMKPGSALSKNVVSNINDLPARSAPGASRFKSWFTGRMKSTGSYGGNAAGSSFAGHFNSNAQRKIGKASPKSGLGKSFIGFGKGLGVMMAVAAMGQGLQMLGEKFGGSNTNAGLMTGGLGKLLNLDIFGGAKDIWNGVTGNSKEMGNEKTNAADMKGQYRRWIANDPERRKGVSYKEYIKRINKGDRAWFDRWDKMKTDGAKKTHQKARQNKKQQQQQKTYGQDDGKWPSSDKTTDKKESSAIDRAVKEAEQSSKRATDRFALAKRKFSISGGKITEDEYGQLRDLKQAEIDTKQKQLASLKNLLGKVKGSKRTAIRGKIDAIETNIQNSKLDLLELDSKDGDKSKNNGGSKNKGPSAATKTKKGDSRAIARLRKALKNAEFRSQKASDRYRLTEREYGISGGETTAEEYDALKGVKTAEIKSKNKQLAILKSLYSKVRGSEKSSLRDQIQALATDIRGDELDFSELGKSKSSNSGSPGDPGGPDGNQPQGPSLAEQFGSFNNARFDLLKSFSGNTAAIPSSVMASAAATGPASPGAASKQAPTIVNNYTTAPADPAAWNKSMELQLRAAS